MSTPCQQLKSFTNKFDLTKALELQQKVNVNGVSEESREEYEKLTLYLETLDQAHTEFVEALKQNVVDWYSGQDKEEFEKKLTMDEDYQFIFDGNIDLSHLTKLDSFPKLLKEVKGDLDLSSLTSAEGLTLPEEIGGGLYLSSLTSAKGLTLPERIGGALNLSSLTSAKGLTLPERIGGDLYLGSLTSAKGLTLPEEIGGYLSLRSLTSAKGLTLPEEIGGYLYLISLKSLTELQIPDSVLLNNPNLSIYVSSEMSQEEIDEFKKRYPTVYVLRT